MSRLETYLEEIDHYLAVGRGKEEILEEIRSHILEKAEKECGGATEEAIGKVIAGYGSPRKVAERYADERPIIAPAFRKYLVRYTLILFALHLGLTILSALFAKSIVIFFFVIPKMDSGELLFYIFMAFFFDLGLVGFFLYWATQRGKEIKLPWLRIAPLESSILAAKMKGPKIRWLVLSLAGFGAALAVYLWAETLFFGMVNRQNLRSLFNPQASKWYSLALLTVIAVAIIAYAVRFFTLSAWTSVAKYAAYLVILALIINNPIEGAFTEHFAIDTKGTLTGLVVFLAILWTFQLIKSLLRLTVEIWEKRRS